MRWSFGMSYILFLSLVTTHKNIQRTENILNIALRAGSVRRTQVLPDIGCEDGTAAGLLPVN